VQTDQIAGQKERNCCTNATRAALGQRGDLKPRYIAGAADAGIGEKRLAGVEGMDYPTAYPETRVTYFKL
jgi:hypothetical protein